MTQSNTETRESESSEQPLERWCFVIDTEGRVVHRASTPVDVPLVGANFDTSGARWYPRPPATMTRPTFDAPWWTVVVEAPSATEAGRTALALVENDREAAGLPAAEFEAPASAPVPAPTDFGAIYDRVASGEGIGPSCCESAAQCTDEREPVLVITGVTDRGRDIIRLSDSFPRVSEVRALLDADSDGELILDRDDVALLVEQAEFWRAEFTHTYNSLWPQVEELRAELAERGAGVDEECDEAPIAEVTKRCDAIPCGETTEVRIEFQETTWDVEFDLNGEYVTINYGSHRSGPELEKDAVPVVTLPDMDDHRYWFSVAVRATNSTTAIERARAHLAAECGITGDGLAVMEGAKTAEEAGASARQLGWLHRWASDQRDTAEGHVAQFRSYVERLEQAGAAI